jgi:hypothetical protein
MKAEVKDQKKKRKKKSGKLHPISAGFCATLHITSDPVEGLCSPHKESFPCVKAMTIIHQRGIQSFCVVLFMQKEMVWKNPIDVGLARPFR